MLESLLLKKNVPEKQKEDIDKDYMLDFPLLLVFTSANYYASMKDK